MSFKIAMDGKKEKAAAAAFSVKTQLLLDDLQDLHGASLDTDAAGDALGSGALGLENHNLHGACLNTLAAADALLLVDHVNASLGVLSDGFMLAGTHALTALDADIGFGSVALGNNLDTGQIGIKFLIECFGTCLNALQAGHALGILLDNEFLHKKGHSFIDILVPFHYTISLRKMQHHFTLFPCFPCIHSQ